MEYNEILSEMTEEELHELFLEVVEYNKKGVLSENAKVRQLREKVLGNTHMDLACFFTCMEINYEIALRHYNIEK